MRFTTNDGVTVHYNRDGEGEAVLFAHGWASDAQVFDKQIPVLADRFRVYRPDFRGHGRSSDASWGGRISRLSMDLHQLLEHEGIEKVTMVGWSMGCSVIWNYIDLFGQDRLDKLVFVEEIPYVLASPAMVEDWDVVDLDTRPLVNLYSLVVPSTVREDGARTFVTGMLKTATPEERQRIGDTAAKVRSFMAASLLIDNNVTDWRDIFSRLRVPVLLVGGSDSFFRTEFLEWMNRQIPDSRLAVREGAGHFLHFEEADWFNDVLVSFLNGAGPEGR